MSLKIIHLSASNKGGAYKMAQNLVDAQNENGIIAHHAVYTGYKNNVKLTPFNWLDKVIKFALHAIEKFIFLFYEKEKSYRFKFSMGYPGMPFFYLKKLVKNYDIVHIHWINKGFINLKHLTKLNKKIVWTTHDIWIATGGCHLNMGCNHFENGCGNCFYLKSPNNHDLSYRLFLTKKHIIEQLAITFVTPSQWMQNNLLRSSITANKPIYNIPNGVDTRIFNFKQNKNHRAFTIGFVAANLNDENKALYRLIEAVNILKTRNNEANIRLILIGEKKQNFNFNIKCEVVHKDYVKTAIDMASEYQTMDVLCVTSTIETLPTTVIEAGCCGVPSIAFNVGGISDVISKENGILIEPFDIQKYADTIFSIYKKPFDKNYVSSYVSNTFGLINTHNKYNDIYSGIVSEDLK